LAGLNLLAALVDRLESKRLNATVVIITVKSKFVVVEQKLRIKKELLERKKTK